MCVLGNKQRGNTLRKGMNIAPLSTKCECDGNKTFCKHCSGFLLSIGRARLVLYNINGARPNNDDEFHNIFLEGAWNSIRKQEQQRVRESASTASHDESSNTSLRASNTCEQNTALVASTIGTADTNATSSGAREQAYMPGHAMQPMPFLVWIPNASGPAMPCGSSGHVVSFGQPPPSCAMDKQSTAEASPDTDAASSCAGAADQMHYTTASSWPNTSPGPGNSSCVTYNPCGSSGHVVSFGQPPPSCAMDKQSAAEASPDTDAASSCAGAADQMHYTIATSWPNNPCGSFGHVVSFGQPPPSCAMVKQSAAAASPNTEAASSCAGADNRMQYTTASSWPYTSPGHEKTSRETNNPCGSSGRHVSFEQPMPRRAMDKESTATALPDTEAAAIALSSACVAAASPNTEGASSCAGAATRVRNSTEISWPISWPSSWSNTSPGPKKTSYVTSDPCNFNGSDAPKKRDDALAAGIAHAADVPKREIAQCQAFDEICKALLEAETRYNAYAIQERESLVLLKAVATRVEELEERIRRLESQPAPHKNTDGTATTAQYEDQDPAHMAGRRAPRKRHHPRYPYQST